MRTTASKAVAFLLTAVPAWGTYAHHAGISAGEWWLLVGIISEAALIYTVPNVAKRPAPWDPPRRDAGQTMVTVLAVIGFLCVLWLVLDALSRH